MTTRTNLRLLAVTIILMVVAGVLTLTAGATSEHRLATPAEAAFCEAHLETLGPITGDCLVVPKVGTIHEDDPWGRWDCRTMGNHTCGDGAGNLTIWFEVDGALQGFDVNDPHRPGCFVEPSDTPEGYDVIHYSRISGRGPPEYIGDPLGFEVRCPR